MLIYYNFGNKAVIIKNQLCYIQSFLQIKEQLVRLTGAQVNHIVIINYFALNIVNKQIAFVC
jgi:hypothetical protein